MTSNTGEGAVDQARRCAAKVVGTALGWARAAGQGAGDTFLYNDYNTGDGNVALLTQLQNDGTFPTPSASSLTCTAASGRMTGSGQSCERFAPFGRPLHFTETTVLSGPRRDL